MWWTKKEDAHKLIWDEMARIKSDLQSIQNSPKHASLPEDYASRIAELEIKLSKMWSLIVQYDERRNKENLTTFAKKTFGGKGF